MRDPAIAARGVSRVYRSPAGSTEALHAVDASFGSGAIGAIVGPSGSGKSTLLRLLARIDEPDAGTIVVDGVDLGGLGRAGARRYRRRTAAYLAQRAASNLVPHLTISEQLGRQGAALAETLGIAHRLAARAGELSGGEQARAALAVGLSRDTPLVLLDEPTAELDRHAAQLVIEALERTAAAGRTVVVATHDPDLIGLAAKTLDLAPAGNHTRAAGRITPGRGGEAIAARGVSKAYDGARVVDGATLSVAPGELAVLLGRSGSGKSTLLMLLGGFVAADAGEIVTPGAQWHQTAYLAQRFGLLAELTIAENVDLPHRLGLAPAGNVLDTLELAALTARVPRETSVGQQQRAALARAVAARPRALLADEPTSHQDASSAERVWTALARACDDGTACLVATHDEDAAPRADRVWRIEDGRVSPA